jgi:hypothetical protein
MKTNSSWIKTDYRVQSALVLIISSLLLIGLFCGLLIFAGWDEGIWGIYYVVFIVLSLFTPFGLWQVVSGLIHAFNGDKLQRIYLAVVAVYFFIGYSFFQFHNYHHLDTDIFLILMGIIALVIAVWKYTVVRADYISLKIIDVPKVEIDNLLDA